MIWFSSFPLPRVCVLALLSIAVTVVTSSDEAAPKRPSPLARKPGGRSNLFGKAAATTTTTTEAPADDVSQN